MVYPTGSLLAVLAGRILANLDFVADQASKSDAASQDRVPYEDTQLLISLLGVLVFPHEQVPKALGKLLRDYPDLGRVLKVKFSQEGNRVELTDADGVVDQIDPTRITDLPALLRNCVAHFNVLPIEKRGQFGGIRVWNRTPKPDSQITFVADIDFEELRSLARHLLTAMREHRVDVPLQDPPDPMNEVEEQRKNPRQPKMKVPGLIEDIWFDLVDGHGGDQVAAKTKLDRLLRAEVKRLQAVQKRGQ